MRCGRLHIAGVKRGFTLVEILVVVAIVALMAAILFPSLRAAKEQAMVTVCLTNLHDTGLAMHEYSVQYDPYYPLVSYMGSSIHPYHVGADDNLFVLWYKKFCPDVKTFTCPSTAHSIRKPLRVIRNKVTNAKVKGGFGYRYDIYCDPDHPNAIRNDWEYHGQLMQEVIDEPTGGVQTVEGHGTSYEYLGWINNNKRDKDGNYLIADKNGNPPIRTTINWYPFTKLQKIENVHGEPLMVRSLKTPAASMLMKDADEGGTIVVKGSVVTRNAAGNVPESWDNHSNKRGNFLYGDGHVATKWWDLKKGDWAK